MADISMCEGINCPVKNTCYRHTAPQNPYRQAWLAETPTIVPNKQCEFYIKDEILTKRNGR